MGQSFFLNSIIIIITRLMFMVLSSWQAIVRVYPIHLVSAILVPTLRCMYVCMYGNLCSRNSLQPRLSRRRYDQS